MSPVLKFLVAGLLMLFTSVPAARAAVVGRAPEHSIIVSGNRLPASDLTVDNGKLYAGDIQIYPMKAVPQMAPSVDEANLAKKQHRLVTEVRTLIRDKGNQRLQLATARFSLASDFVDTSWVSGGSVWVKWRTGATEEFPDLGTTPEAKTGPTMDVATAIGTFIAESVSDSGEVYVGEGYFTVIAKSLVPYYRLNLERLTANPADESVSLVFRKRNAALANDVRKPKPLSGLKRR